MSSECGYCYTSNLQYCHLSSGIPANSSVPSTHVFCYDCGASYKEPMPWIGVYVAAASLVCSLAMGADVFHGFRHKKLWFPCKFFTLNAASLTLLAIAMKLPLDLTTTMKGGIDQLAKLSSTVLMCIIMGNFMPSLGRLVTKEIFRNIIALGILLITIVVNVCIQLRTGIIHGLRTAIVPGSSAGTMDGIWYEHVLVLFFMLLVFVILSFSALTVPTTKEHIELEYRKEASSDQSDGTGNFTTVEKLETYVKKYWMMAATGNPQFVMARSVTCSASGAICFLTTLILVEAALRILSTPKYYGQMLIRQRDHHMNVSTKWGYYPRSDYAWSTYLIFVIQSIGVGVGTISLAFRWFTAASFKCSKKGSSDSYKTQFKVENYWVQRLVEWKERPLTLRKFRKLVQVTKNVILDICIGVQIVIVVVSKSVQLFSIFIISPFLSCLHCCIGLRRKLISKSSRASNNDSTGTESERGRELDPSSHHVLYLEGEVELPERILKNIYDVADHLIQEGNMRQPKCLIELLKEPRDCDQAPYLDSAIHLPNCWSLSVVTLTRIAIALPNIGNDVVNQLFCSVREGLLYIRHVEKNEDPKGDLINIRKAAASVWSEVERHHHPKRLDEDHQKIAFQGETSKTTLETLADDAKNTLKKFKNGSSKGNNPLNWPIEVIAASSMCIVTQTMLLEYQGLNDQTDDKLFKQLHVMIANKLSACLVNLRRVITMKCFCSAIEKWEESVREAAHLLGETEEILNILPSSDPDQGAHIDDWRELIKQKILSAFISSSNDDQASSESVDSHIVIEGA